jgi:hypothetical protein
MPACKEPRTCSAKITFDQAHSCFIIEFLRDYLRNPSLIMAQFQKIHV